MIQWSKQGYSNMLWNMRSITRNKRSYGHPLHADLTPDVLTCVLALGTVSSGRENEVESAHVFLTIIQFFSACHLTSQHTSTCIYNSIISHSPTHYKIPVVMGEWRSSRCRILVAVVADLHTGGSVLYFAFHEEKQSAKFGSRLSD